MDIYSKELQAFYIALNDSHPSLLYVLPSRKFHTYIPLFLRQMKTLSSPEILRYKV